MNKKVVIPLLILLGSAAVFYSCRSPESSAGSKKASIDISVEPDPVEFYWYSSEGYAELDCFVTIYERVGVPASITKVTFDCLYENKVQAEFKDKGGRIPAFRSMRLRFRGKVEGKVDQAKITAEGTDGNGHRVYVMKTFLVKWIEA